MTVEVDDVLKVNAKMTMAGALAVQNVFHYVVYTGGPIADSDCVADMAEQLDVMYDTIDDLLSDLLTFDTVSVYNLTQDYAFGEDAWPTLSAGGNSYAAATSGVAALVTGYTAVKRRLGRTFIGGLSFNDLLDYANVGATFLAALTQFAILRFMGFTGGTSGAGYLPVVGSVGKGFSQIREVAIRSLACYQRRRKPGVGL
jgi:hypothetical protein